MAESVLYLIIVNVLFIITFIPAGEIEIEVSTEHRIFEFFLTNSPILGRYFNVGNLQHRLVQCKRLKN
jgi:hypothetical protein